MPSNTKSGILAQQIHDEFLTCKICLEGFTNPKSLDCLHTFCEECIEHHANSESTYKKYSDYREFTCPLCRKRTTLPLGGVKKLPDNFLVANLTEVIDRQKPSKIQACDFCKLVNKKHKEATAKCLDCNKLLCAGCVDQHGETKVTRNHNIFDIEIEKDIECKEHSDEVVRFYCATCEQPVCILCTFNDHKDHDVAQFSDAVEKYKANIENMMKDCQSHLNKFETQIATLGQCERCIKEAIAKIHDVAIDMISDIRNRERVLIEEIQNMYGTDLMKMVESREDLQRNLDGLRGTVQLTNLIIKGKDMELLLLQKEIQEKLQSFIKNVPADLPKTAFKRIHYVPGMLDMGYIHDSDRPILSQTRRTFSHQSLEQDDFFETADFFDTAETQTECTMMNQKDASMNTINVKRCEASNQTEYRDLATPDYKEESKENGCDETPGERRRRRRREREKTASSVAPDEQCNSNDHRMQNNGYH